ncbi:hypothetical protein BDY24DRAFT_4964 [Mrakia frigida]|uniref:uncharacterized protein n=1 Tax=Mrakia frigida TaxID=29902 RepID=UPI003FCBF538
MELLERRRREAKELLRDVKGALWRPAGEGPKRPGDLERVFVLAMRKASRSFISAYGIRAGFNLFLFLFRSVSSRSFNIRHLVQALFSSVPLRFSLLFSTFSYLHTVTFHILRLSPTPGYLKRRISHSLNLLRASTAETSSFLEALEEGLDVLSKEAPFGMPSADFDETDGERKWHAAMAGFVAGAGSIYWISGKGGERRGVVEQLVVRGLEGFWNGTTRRLGFHVPGGDILLFGLCSGQLMHSWLSAPSRNPPSFNHFISGAFQGPSSAVAIQRSLLNGGKMPHDEVQNLLSYKRGVTESNRSSLESILETLGGFDLVWKGGPMVPCSALHPDHDSCTMNLVARFFLVFKHMLPVYGALHFIPQLIFKRRLLFSQPSSSDPPSPISDDLDGEKTPPALEGRRRTMRAGGINWKELTKLLWRGIKGTLRSGSFLGGFVVIFHAIVCLQHKIYPLLKNRTRLRELLVAPQYMWFAGFMTTFSLFLEEKRRRSELALYVLPRGLSVLHSMLRKRAWIPRHVPLGEGVLAGLAMAILCDRSRWGQEDLGGLVKRVMYQFT